MKFRTARERRSSLGSDWSVKSGSWSIPTGEGSVQTSSANAFCWQTRQKNSSKKRPTAAMMAGLAGHVWNFDELFAAVLS